MNDPNIQLLAEDEVHFQRHTSITRMWSIKGSQPQIASASTREKIGFFGAINLKSGRLLMKKEQTFNSNTFYDFIKHILRHSRGKIYLILDNARWHRAKELKVFVQKKHNRIKLIFLPSYSPELNPIERVWRITRRIVTHNRYFESIKNLENSLNYQFENWYKPNKALKTLCAKI